MSPLISIVTICRNDVDALQRTYRSVLAQERSLFEWIVIDGASTDATLDFLKTLPSDLVQWTSEPDEGIYDAMNKGILRSAGAYCVFMNAGDDFAGSDTLSLVAPFLNRSNDIVYGDGIEVFDGGEAYKTAFPASRYWYSMFTHHQAIIYRREVVLAGYDKSFRLAADWALTSQLIMSGARSAYVFMPICRFHRGGSSDNQKLRAIADRELWRIYREVHRHNYPTALALYALKRGANVLRFWATPLYERIRMRSISAPARKQTPGSGADKATRNTRVFLHFPYYSGPHNSMGIYVDDLHKALSNDDFDVIMCSIMSHGKFTRQISVGGQLSGGINGYAALIYLYIKMVICYFIYRPKLIINMSQEFIFPAFLSRSINVIYDTIQNTFPRSRFVFYYMKFMWVLARCSRGNITISHATKSDLLKLRIPADVVYSHFDEGEIRKYKSKVNKKVFDGIWCGTAARHKNLDLFIELARKQMGRRFAAIIPEGDRCKIFVPDNMEVYSNMEPDNYYLLIEQSKLFISTSFVEGYGRPSMEALLLGVPVLISDIPVYREIYGRWAVFHDMTLGDINDKFEALMAMSDDERRIDLSMDDINKVQQSVSAFLPIIKSFLG